MNFSASHDSDDRIKTTEFYIEWSHIKATFSIVTLIEVIKDVFCGKFKFENREKSKFIFLFGNSGRSRTQNMDQNQNILLKSSSSIVKFSIKILMDETEPIVHEEKRV